MINRCAAFPHCVCGIELASKLADEEYKMIIFRGRDGSLKRVPTSEVMTFAIVEEVEMDQHPMDCPKHHGAVAHKTEMEGLT